MAQPTRKPPMDPELRASLNKQSFPPLCDLNDEVIIAMRRITATPSTFLSGLDSQGIMHKEVRVRSQDGSGHEINLSVLQRASQPFKSRPCLYWIHGGAFHWGDRLHTLEFAIDTILECDSIVVSVEYRLSPENSYSTASEDCYAGLQWVSEHVQHLGIDPKYLMIGGISAGGKLAATVALLCRDRRGPSLCAQCLVCPAVDDRLSTASSHQYLEPSDFLTRLVIEKMWQSTSAKDISNPETRIALPGTVKNLSGLPTAYLDVGSAEVLRDETVAYASNLWKSGVQAELHVWAGGFHGFDIFLPEAALSRASRKAKLAWAKRTFGNR